MIPEKSHRLFKIIEIFNRMMIFNICPNPDGCVENQFAPFRALG